MRIVWHSNWVRAPTGYGKQTRHVVCRLSELGNEVYVSANYGLHGRPLEVDGVVHLPGLLGGRAPLYAALGMHVSGLKPDVVVTLMDVWPLPEDMGQRIRAAGSRWVPWVPLDHHACPEKVRVRLQHASAVVAMSSFGRTCLGDVDIDSVHIPHGVETDVFSPGHQREARKALGLPEDRFLVLMVQANSSTPSRKCFQQQFEGFARFHQQHTESLLYLHSWAGTEHGGLDLASLARATGIQDSVICQDRYQAFLGLPDETMAQIYRASDVTLNATGGEGFGVPIIESLACGVPVIATDFSAMSELCPSEVGWRVGWSERLFTPLDAYLVFPDPAQIAQALEAAFVADRQAMKQDCVEFARQFDADRLVSERWVPFLASLVEGDQRKQDLLDIR